MRHRITQEERGFTLIEVLVASIILAVGVFGTVALVDGSNQATAVSMSREAATNVGRQLVENARLVPYPKATAEQLMTELQSRPDMADESDADGWQLKRRDRIYTVDATVCLLDDPKDGVGEHDASFCPDSAAAGTADGNAKDYKRVSFSVRWGNQAGRQRQLRQATILTPRGTADLPRVTNLSMTQPFAAAATPTPVIDEQYASASVARFKVDTSTVPQGVSWLLEGGIRGLASGSGLTWYFDWPLSGRPDGTYALGAQPFDASGASGEATQMSVTLNRFKPVAPSPFYAGFNIINTADGGNYRLVDAEWGANSEKDVRGYRVYYQQSRIDNTMPQPVTRACPAPAAGADAVTSETTCSFVGPEVVNGLAKLKVWVVALDHLGNTTTLREGDPATVEDAYVVDKAPTAPNDPATVSKPGDGTVVLTWAPSTDPDPAPDKVIYYRIYRNGVYYTRTPFETASDGSTRRFVDADPLVGDPIYDVRAVDTHMKSSGPKKYPSLTYP